MTWAAMLKTSLCLKKSMYVQWLWKGLGGGLTQIISASSDNYRRPSDLTQDGELAPIPKTG